MNAVGVGGLIHLTVSRKGIRRELQFTLGERRQTVFHLEDVRGITTEQKQHRHEWLFGEDTSTIQPIHKLKPEHSPSRRATPQSDAFKSPDGPMTRSSDSP